MSQYIFEFQKKHTVFAIFMLTIVFLLCTKAITFSSENVIFLSGYSQEVFRELLMCILATGFLLLSGANKTIVPSRRKFFVSLKIAGFEIAIIALLLLLQVIENNDTPLLGLQSITMFLFFVLLVGYAEEVFFRGVVENLLLEKYGNSCSGVIFSIILSGIIFGVSHISNISLDVPVTSVFIQVVQCFSVGLFYGAVYMRTKNICALIFLHGLSDFAALANSGVWGVGNIETNISDLDVFNLTGVLVYLIPTVYLIRKEMIQEYVNESFLYTLNKSRD